MQAFATYIEYLLMTRHYCYVPGRGAYMLADEPATSGATPHIGEDSRRLHCLSAPRRIVRFSPLHSHDDGMLANLLMEAEGMTYDDACRYIERQAPLLSEDFVVSASLDTDTDNFGFESLELETWSDIEYRQTREQQQADGTLSVTGAASDKHEADVIAIPKYWVKRAAVACLIALFFFTNFIGLNQGPAQLASVLNFSALQRNVATNAVCGNEQETAIGTEASAMPDHSDVAVIASQATAAQTATAAQFQEQGIKPRQTASDMTYYVVVASTVSEEEALRVCEKYRAQGFPNVGIMANDGRYRLFINTFYNFSEARSYLNTIRATEEKFGHAWLLKIKDGSLSYIIKNIYNDNQLSMELSHPKQRTERDQG